MDTLETALKKHGAALLMFIRQWVPEVADAEDVLQDAIVKYWKSGDSKNEHQGLLFQCARNAALDFLRRNSRRKRREDRSIREQLDRQKEMLTGPSDQEPLRAQIEEALSTLSIEQREVVVMKIWGELTFAEISQALQIPLDTAASRYRYAMAALRRKLSQENEE